MQQSRLSRGKGKGGIECKGGVLGKSVGEVPDLRFLGRGSQGGKGLTVRRIRG